VDAEHAWQADISDVAAAMIERPVLLAEMLDSWLDSFLALQFHLQGIENQLDEHFGGVLPEFQRRQLRLVHDKLIKTFRVGYLVSDRCPLVMEFFRLLEHHEFDRNTAAVWLTDPEECLKPALWAAPVIEVIGMIQQRVKLQSAENSDPREQVMRDIIKQHPGKTGTAWLELFREECERLGLPGIAQAAGRKMIRRITGKAKQARNSE
jgi:hypothetical protein